MQKIYINQSNGLHLEYIPRFYSYSFNKLYNELPLKNITFYKKSFYHKPLRKVCAFSDIPGKRYYYGRQYVEAITWPPLIRAMKHKVEDYLGIKFNFALVNYYPDGKAGIGKHSDDESCMDLTKPIACLNFGATRKLIFREKEGKDYYELKPEHESLYVMKYPINEKWTHEIPAERKIKEPRISITFRVFN